MPTSLPSLFRRSTVPTRHGLHTRAVRQLVQLSTFRRYTKLDAPAFGLAFALTRSSALSAQMNPSKPVSLPALPAATDDSGFGLTSNTVDLRKHLRHAISGRSLLMSRHLNYYGLSREYVPRSPTGNARQVG